MPRRIFFSNNFGIPFLRTRNKSARIYHKKREFLLTESYAYLIPVLGIEFNIFEDYIHTLKAFQMV